MENMYEIVVLSGKGGTGKTSITAALSVLAGDTAIIADCDVDAANMHLLLKPDFAKSSDFYSGEIAEIDQTRCINCGKCQQVCRFDAISIVDENYIIDELDCEGCDYCQKICPAEAILMKPRKSGVLYVSNTRIGVPMVHAKMEIGADNSGKLVAMVKSEAKSLCQQLNREFVIIDGSPGTGCPVVSALAGARFVLLVTEPTMSGLHDLKRVYDVIKKMKIRTACIINKSDLNPSKTNEIKSYLKAEEITHLADIKYDANFVKAMMAGKTVAEYESETAMKIKEVWAAILRLSGN
jgi:MinD superfamily P-loop ATPase